LSTRGSGKCSADGGHHASATAGEQIHAEICERFSNRTRVLIVLKRA
jgi:hypothetical protein